MSTIKQGSARKRGLVKKLVISERLGVLVSRLLGLRAFDPGDAVEIIPTVVRTEGEGRDGTLGRFNFKMRALLLLSLAAATTVNALMPSEIVASGRSPLLRVSNGTLRHSRDVPPLASSSSSSSTSSLNNSSRACSGPDPEFFCNRDDLCIPMALHCDGRDDCSDGEDEFGCKLKCDKVHLFACKYEQ